MSQERRSLFARKLWAGVLLLSINLSFAGVGAILLSPDFAYAETTVTLSPIGIGNYDQWSSGTNKVDAVAVSNGDTSYIREGTNNQIQTFSFENAGIPAGAIINSVTLYSVSKRTGSNGVRKFVLGVENGPGTFNDGDDIIAGFTYSTSSRVMTTNPLTGVAWTLSEVNSWTTKFGVKRSNATDVVRVTQLYVVVDYTANTAPVAEAKSISTSEDTATSSVMVAIDANGNTLTYTVLAGPTHGVLSGDAPSFIYTPAANYNGPDSVTFKANDGTADSNTATVSITVNAVNDAPVLSPIGNQVATELVALNLIATSNDIDGAAPTYSLSGEPAGAEIIPSTGAFSWEPSEAQGPNSYTFDIVVSDGTDIDRETITVDVDEGNIAPTASSTEVSTHINTDKDISLSADDIDIPTNELTYSIVTYPEYGTLDLMPGNQVTYTPEEDYVGADSFTFKANDGTADSNTATVTINVDNSAPTINSIKDQVATEMVALDLTGMASDPDEDMLTFSLGTAPSGASVDESTGEFSWTPDEDDGGGVFPVTIIVSDGNMSDSASFNITVTETNEAPVAEDKIREGESGAIVTPEDTSVVITLVASDSDLPAQTLTFSTTTNPLYGTLVMISENQVTYTPSLNYNGPDSFTFKANDGTADSNTATVDITVTPINDAPEIELVGLSLWSVTVGGTYTEQGATTSDVDSEVLTSTTTGSVDTNTIGSYTLVYEVSDGALSASTTRTVNVTAVPQEPTPEPAPTPVNPPGAVGLAFLGGNAAPLPAGLVLGASTTTVETAPGEVCSAAAGSYLRDYLRMGLRNDPEQVIKLQKFLNESLGLNIPVTGFFGPLTFNAVKQFQLANADQVLDPWVPFGLPKATPTGHVYKTTKRWINILQCKSVDIPMPLLS